MNSEPRSTALLNMVRDDVPDDLRARIERAVRPVWVRDWADRPRPEVEILVTPHDRLTPDRLAALPGLRVVLATSTAVDYVDRDYCAAHGVRVHNTPDYTGSSVAEHAMALMLAVVRHIPRLDDAARTDADSAGLVARELTGAVAGVVGLGGIGRRIATLAQGFGMDVQFANRSPRTLVGARQVELATLLQTSDVVFLSLPLPSGGGAVLGVSEFALLKPSAVVVNVSADELIDRYALERALTSGRIAGAGLDVIGDPAPYRDLPNTVLTPRRAWYTREAVRRRAATWVDTLCAIAGGRPVNRVL
ncbi:2-hydroxyacid dehydrogenase [Nocardia terpenica]|uniref:2-hydroxyacid dehydrogenase n=1 Tax=Nocardia terpenica TaxID=455432 RepID=UPI002B4ABE1D|nr:D-isomer specific 2-hydroxyacid dehydrogenase family protein [Nocardia terpenica]